MERNRKGNVADIFVFMMIIVFIAITFIVVTLVNTQLQDIVQTTELNSTTAAPSIIDGFDNLTTTWVNRGFMIVFAIMVIGIMVSAFLTRVHPAFLFLYLFVLGTCMFTAVLLANIYADLTENQHLVDIVANQPAMNFIMTHLVVIILAVGALSMIFSMAKIFPTPGAGGGTDI